MKLWQKLTLVCVSVLLVFLSITLFAMIHMQTRTMRKLEEQNAFQVLDSCVRNVRSAISQQGLQYREITERSVVQYLFSEYVKIAHSEKVRYSLVVDGEYLADANPYDPIALMPPVFDDRGDMPLVRRYTLDDGQVVWVGCDSMLMNEKEYYVYICVNTTDSEQLLRQLRAWSLGLLAAAGLITSLLIAVFLKKLLKPIAVLTATTVKIADGDYHLRSQYLAQDEVGILSRSFDRMADAIADKIAYLQEEIQRRQLLLGSLSHEIRTPMTAIVGYAEALLQMPLDKDQQIVCASRILEAGKRAENLSTKMMELVGLAENRNIEKKVFPALSITDSLKTQYGEQLIIDCEVENLYGDETLLHSMLVNLVQNAVRASAESEKVKVSILRSDKQIEIQVQDHGCGIPAEHIPSLTEPFYRVDKARSRKDGGAGLGLAICQLIAKLHDGILQVESEVGVGTTVTVCIALHTS